MQHSTQRPDPFGRLMSDDGSQSRFQNLTDIYALQGTVGPDGENQADDIAKVEILMDQLGEIDLSQTDGPTGYYGERLKQAVQRFQKKSGLAESGRVAPADPTIRAIRRALEETHPSNTGPRDGGISHPAATPSTPPLAGPPGLSGTV